MTESIIDHPLFKRWFPVAGGLFLATLFISLGSWQLGRAAEKGALRALFADDVAAIELATYLASEPQPVEFQPVTTHGRFDTDHQVFLNNAFVNNQSGYFVLTPLEQGGGRPAILVNRGFVPRVPAGADLPDITVGGAERTIRARIGDLPRTGLRQRPPFEEDEAWPRMANQPTLGQLADALDRELAPVVLLLDAAEADGYTRRWLPENSGSGTHYNYALQWFAMAVAVLVGAGWWWRRQRG